MVKLQQQDDIRNRANIIIIGAPSVIGRGESTVDVSIERRHIDKLEPQTIENELLHLDLDVPGIDDVPMCQTSAAGGQSSLQGLEKAFELAKAGIVGGVCFMPFNIASMHLGGNRFMDEIGFARDYFGVETRASEFNIAHGMWNDRVTSHVAMKDVPSMLSKDRICDSIELAHNTLKMAGYKRPKIVVAAYNPMPEKVA